MASAADAGGFFRDLMLRALVASVAGAIVSGGIVYFAFDQALRGVETAIGVTNERLGSIDRRPERMDGRLDGISETLAERRIERIEDTVASRAIDRRLVDALLQQMRGNRSLLTTLESISPDVAMRAQMVAQDYDRIISDLEGLSATLSQN
jgi:hypothetical protein